MVLIGSLLAVLNYFVAAMIDVFGIDDVPPPLAESGDAAAAKS
jgi:hypothetical protein